MCEEKKETENTVAMSVEIGKLAEALSKAQSEIKGATKDAENPFYRSRYADLNSVWEACRGPLSKYGLAVIQTTDGTAEKIVIMTTLGHSSGQWIRGRLVMNPVKTDPQGIGSALTYGRRYALSAIVGVVPEEDDDGNRASGLREAKAEHKPERATPGKRATPGVDEMLETGQAVPVKPAPTASTTPSDTEAEDPLKEVKTLMELSGVGVDELKAYLEKKDWIKSGGKVIDMDRNIYDQMIQTDNWNTVVERIKKLRK